MTLLALFGDGDEGQGERDTRVRGMIESLSKASGGGFNKDTPDLIPEL